MSRILPFLILAVGLVLLSGPRLVRADQGTGTTGADGPLTPDCNAVNEYQQKCANSPGNGNVCGLPYKLFNSATAGGVNKDRYETGTPQCTNSPDCTQQMSKVKQTGTCNEVKVLE